MIGAQMKLFFSYIVTIFALIIFTQPAHPTTYKKQAVKKVAVKKKVAKKTSLKSIISNKDRRCLALNIYWEARNEYLNGQIAIGYVTINRVFSYNYPFTICEVVWEKRRSKRTKKLVPQFSWTMDGKFDTPKNKLAWLNAKNVADYVLKYYSKESDPTKGALHYHANYVKPRWAKKMKVVKTMGAHIFYVRK